MGSEEEQVNFCSPTFILIRVALLLHVIYLLSAKDFIGRTRSSFKNRRITNSKNLLLIGEL